jgi:hypothetical protein
VGPLDHVAAELGNSSRARLAGPQRCPFGSDRGVGQPGLVRVRREDHAMVLRMLAKSHLEFTALRAQAVCRLHSVLVQLGPGGIPPPLG